MAATGGDYINSFMNDGNSGVAGGVNRRVTTGTVNGKPVNVPQADELGNPLNSQAYIDHLNQQHPEYSGKPATPAFDPKQQVGHNGTINGLNREQYRDAWLSSGGKNNADLDAFTAAHGGSRLGKNGVVMTPFGEQIDMGQSFSAGDGRAQWGGVGGPAKPAGGAVTSSLAAGAAPTVAGAPAPAAAGGAVGAGGASGAGVTVVQPNPGEVDPFGGAGVKLSNGQWVPKNHPLAQQAQQNSGAAPATGAAGTPGAAGNLPPTMASLLNTLQTRSQQGLDVDPNDPVIKNQVDAYGAQAERARRNYLADNAEGSSPFASGAQRGQERMTAEKVGQDVGGFQSQLMGRELTARRTEIQSALDSMGNLLTENQRQALQRELAAADNALKRYGIDTQNNQYYSGLSQNDRQFTQQLSQQERLAQLDNGFRYAQLGQDNSHFLDNMGFQQADRGAYWDAVHNGQLGQ